MVKFWLQKIRNLIKQLLAEIKSDLKEVKVTLRRGPLPVSGRSKALSFIYYLGHKIKNLMLFRSIVARVVAKHLVSSKIGKTILDFLTNHRLFLILSLLLISFLVEISLVQKLAYGQLLAFALITLANLYICERKYRASGGDLRYLLPMFFFVN
jgi:hypothetical protein